MSKDPTCIQPYLQNFNFFLLYECPQCHSRYSVNMGIQLELRFSQLQKRAVFNFQSFQEKRLSLWCFTQCLPCNFNPWNHPFMTFPSNIRGWQPTEEGVLCVHKVHRFLKMFRSVIWFNLLPSSCNHLGVDHVDILCDYLTMSHPGLTELLFFFRLKIKLLAFYSLIRLEPIPEP